MITTFCYINVKINKSITIPNMCCLRIFQLFCYRFVWLYCDLVYYRIQWTAEGSVFFTLSVTFLFVHEISPEPLNGFAPNSQGRRIWLLARTSLNVKVKGQGHQGQKRRFSAPSSACVRFMFGKTSVASSFDFVLFKTVVTCAISSLI